MRQHKGIFSLLLAALLCLSFTGPAAAQEPASGEAGNRSIQVTVRELTPGYYLCAVWDGGELLTLFDATVGNDGILNQTVEIGKVLEPSDTLQVGISGANTGENAASYQVVLTGPNVPDNKPGDVPDNPSEITPIFGSWAPSGPVQPSYGIAVPTVSGGVVSISPQSAVKGTSVTLTATPDSGYELSSLTVTDIRGNELELTDKGGGKYTFTMPDGKVTINAAFQPIPEEPQRPEIPWNNPFADVTAGAWYYDAVKFVNENDLMHGVTDSRFAPDANLTRAQLAQILYNREGTPSASGSSIFPDVKNDAWYADAVIWAAANGIVTGYESGLFGPDDPITREQLAVILWRHAGKPASGVELSFPDAGQVSGYAAEAICWAVERGILKGTDTGILAPGGVATRAEAAQMLMNCLQ